MKRIFLFTALMCASAFAFGQVPQVEDRTILFDQVLNNNGYEAEVKTQPRGMSPDVCANANITWTPLATLAKDVTTYVHKDQPIGTDFCYRVRAIDMAGDFSGWSNEAFINVPLGTPANLEAR